MKDLLYTLAPNSPGRRSAQTAMSTVVMTLAKLLAPVMPYTADEVWSCLSAREVESVHLAAFPAVVATLRDAELEARWQKLLNVREAAALQLEKARQSQVIGKSLEAQVEIEPDNDATRELLENFGPLLETVMIVSRAYVGKPTGGELRVTVRHADGKKCGRCWRWTDDVGADGTHPELCGRCVSVVKERLGTTL